jgi:hypothetical protein
MPKFDVVETTIYQVQTRRRVEASNEDVARRQGQVRAIRDADIMQQLLQLPEPTTTEDRPASFSNPVVQQVRRWTLTRVKSASQTIQTTALEVKP